MMVSVINAAQTLSAPEDREKGGSSEGINSFKKLDIVNLSNLFRPFDRLAGGG
jgi:hypothetical protein